MKHPQPGQVGTTKLYWYWLSATESIHATTWAIDNDPKWTLLGTSVAEFTVPAGFKFVEVATANLQKSREEVVAEFTAKLRDIDTALANLQAITWEEPQPPVVEPLANEDFQRGYEAAQGGFPHDAGESVNWLEGYDAFFIDTPEEPQ